MLNSLKEELLKIIPAESLIFDYETRMENSRDASLQGNNESIADVVAFPSKTEHIQGIMRLANKYKFPVICRGAGTNTVGACKPENGGIVINMSKMNKILGINVENMTARVQSGVIVGDLQKEAEKFGLYYPPDPSNLAVSTIGGSIAQNSAGARTFKYGSTKDYILSLSVVTANGEILNTGFETIKNSTGYNLTSIFIGSEGTLGIVTEATVKLIVKPQTSKVIMAYFDTLNDMTIAVSSIISEHLTPATIDFMDKNAIYTVEKYKPTGLLTNKDAMLLIEVDGTEISVENETKKTVEVLKNNNASNITFSQTQEEADKIWFARRSSMTACKELKPDVATDDLIVPRQNLTKLVQGVQKICDKYNLTVCMVGHIGDGSVHPQIPINLKDKDEYNRLKQAKEEFYDLTAELGGTISGEHGIGCEKREYLTKILDKNAIEYMKQIKHIFDPNNILNPNKIWID